MSSNIQVALLVFGTVIAVTIVSIAFTLWRARRRSRQLNAFAAESGLSFRADGGDLLATGIVDLPLFGRGAVLHRATITNVMTGRVAGVPLTVCDYAYWTGSHTDQRFDYAQSVVCFHLEPRRYPPFTIYPRGGSVEQASLKIARRSGRMLAAAGRLGNGGGRLALVETLIDRDAEPGIEPDASQAFASQYRVMGEDRNRIARVLRKTALDSLAAGGFHPLSVECSGPWLAVYRKNHTVKPADMLGFLERCASLRQTLFAD